MAALATQDIRRSGTVPSMAAAAAGGDTFTPSIDTFVIVTNGGVGSITVTVDTPNEAFPDVGIAQVSVTVTAGQTKHIGPFNYDQFAQSDGTAAMTYSGVTSVTVGVFKLRKP